MDSIFFPKHVKGKPVPRVLFLKPDLHQCFHPYLSIIIGIGDIGLYDAALIQDCRHRSRHIDVNCISLPYSRSLFPDDFIIRSKCSFDIVMM